MKRPAFQFYPADWRKDAALQSCSMSAQGLWMNLLCVMHECDPYGHLSVNEKPMNTVQIARLVGMAQKDCERLLIELAEAGVSATSETGFVFSRRMVRDERIRNIRADAGRLGGNPKLVGKKVKQIPNLVLTPSSSSSSSPSVKEPPTPKGAGRFGEFWSAWPKSNRKGGRPECLKVWEAKGFDCQAEVIVAHVSAMAKTPDWKKESGQYIPAPVVYLRGQKWDGAEVDAVETYAGAI